MSQHLHLSGSLDVNVNHHQQRSIDRKKRQMVEMSGTNTLPATIKKYMVKMAKVEAPSSDDESVPGE